MSANFIDLVKQTLLVDVEAWGDGSVGRAAGGGRLLACAANRTTVCHRMAASWRTRHWVLQT